LFKLEWHRNGGVVKTFRWPHQMVDFRSDQIPNRYVMPDACVRLDAEFSFPPLSDPQDWEIELSDGSRLLEFVDAYSALELNDDERFALMALIVASAEDAIDHSTWSDQLWSRIHDLLLANFDLHAATIRYWCCPQATHPDQLFSITPRIRDIWSVTFGPKA
jgi:hypothetical protein